MKSAAPPRGRRLTPPRRPGGPGAAAPLASLLRSAESALLVALLLQLGDGVVLHLVDGLPLLGRGVDLVEHVVHAGRDHLLEIAPVVTVRGREGRGGATQDAN